MSTETVFVERIVLTVDGVDLDDVINSVTEEGATPTKYVNTMNKARRPRGVKQGNSTFDLSMDAERIVDPTIPDWYGLMTNRTTIQVVSTPNIGPSITYTGRVTKVSDKTSDGDSSRSITMMCWQRK